MEADARLTLPFTVRSEGRYAVRLIAFTGSNRGLFDVELDGKVAREAVDFASLEEETDLLLGTHTLTAGEHTLGFRALATGADIPSVGAGMPCGEARAENVGSLAVEMLRLLALPPEAERAIKTEYEAHFIRMGIGRAVYAYRLAYGELPGSLDALVEAGIMDAYYLHDENRSPLRSRLESDRFIVESQGPGAWQHSWQGLDARR
jgi:hypothetical protein